MTTKELIHQKIDAYYTEYKAKFHQNGDSYHLGIIDGLDMAERILDTLPDEPEQPTRGYDEAYLNEKIAKASKSWEGVDVDKFMDEVRGREPVSEDLEEAARAYSEEVADGHNYRDLTCGFIAGAEWQKRKMIEGATYNELMELYRAIRDELVKRHRDVPVNIKEEL